MFYGTPEEIEKHAAYHERLAAEAEVAGHLVADVLHALDEDQCRAVKSVLTSVRGSGNHSSAEAVTASFYIGILSSRLHVEFGVCLSCGKHHDQEIADELAAQEPPA